MIMLPVLLLSGCKKDEVEEPVSLIKKANITLTGAQEVPAVNTTGTGSSRNFL